MQKTMKRILAFVMAVAICFSTMPFSAFAAEIPAEAPTADAVTIEPEEPELTATPEPDDNSSPRGSPESAEETPAPTVQPEAETEQNEDELAPGTELDVYQVWPAPIRRSMARVAASVGTTATLFMWDASLSGSVGTLPTMNEHVGPMPLCSMMINGNYVAAYCIEHQKESWGGASYTWMDLTTQNQEIVGTIIALGFQWESPSGAWTSRSDDGDKWVVTQLLVWEALTNNITIQSDGSYSVKSGVDTDMQMVSAYAFNATRFMDYYRSLKQKLTAYGKIPSFAATTASKADPITLRWDGEKYSATVTDSNGVLANYSFNDAISGVTIRASGNNLTLSTTNVIMSPKTSSRVENLSATAGGSGAVAVWRTSDRTNQDFATYYANGADPVGCYIKVKTDAVGDASVKKTSDDGKVEGITFQITGSDGSSMTKTTDADGNIDMEGMPIYMANGSKITYTATEVNVPNKYIKPQSQTFQLTEGQTATVHFNNKLKQWRVTVTKTDSKTGSTAQGNASLKGAVFGVYQGSTLVKEYTVGDDNTFVTDYYPYGEDWTLKEISGGEGYKVSEVVTNLCEIPDGSNEEFNENTATVTNEVIRGGVSVQKRDSVTGETPQGDANFAGIVFEIINDSQNPVEVDGKVAAPGRVAKEIATNAQGFATTGPNSLPYGDYIIREKSTNTSMLKTFTEEIKVTVSEDGKVYDFTAENDVVRGGIAIEKHDSQTGATPQGNADFSGIVFEIVNSSANAVIVDGESYAPGSVVATLTTDKDGRCSTADDALPYGRYTVREKSTNNSMLLTFRQQTVTVAENKKNYTVTANNDVVRGGLSVQKLDSQTGASPQGDSDFSGIVFEIINDSKNPVMVGGASYAPGKVVKEITTNATGFATTGPNDLPYGDYIVREKSTNKSMLLTFTQDINVTVSEHSKVYPFTADNDVVRCGIEVNKHDSQTGVTPQGNADFAGITFEIVNISKNSVVVDGKSIAPGEVATTITTDGNGHAATADDALPYGRYTVREASTNKSMLLTWHEQSVTATENRKIYSVTAVDDVVRGGLAVEKRDTITVSTPQGDADFEGITFEVINNSKNPVIVNDKSIAPGEIALTLTTDAEGKCSTANNALPYGEYILHEASTNKSMLNTAEDQIVTIDEHLKMYTHYMDNEVVRGGVLIEKRDLESLLLTPLGGASLDGTLFEITNKSKRAVYVNGALYEPDEVCLTIEVKDGVAQSGDHALPYGTYSMVESKPGKGYLWTDKKVRDFTVRENGEVTEYREGDAAYNQVIRGDLKFIKVGEKNMHRFANVAFKLTSQTTGESHILVTDENGEVRTENQWNAHTLNTNSNDDKPEIEWDDLTGSWYGLTTEGWIVETQDGLSALPFDHYTLEELRCAGNEGYDLVTVPDISITRNTVVIDLGTIDDQEDNGPKIGTTATVDGEHIATPVGEVTIVDVVAYSNLEVGKTYKLSGVLMDKETGKPLEIDGQQITAEKEFTPEKSSGTEEISFTFNASALAGKSVVVFEDLYQGEKKVTSHADIEDEGQTVTFTEVQIGTTATVDGEHTAEPVGEITLIDTVAYSGLTVGKEYTVKGVLMDKASGAPLLVDGQEITAEASFIASQSEGSIDIPFTFDGSALSGKTVVAFETLYHEGIEVAVHADIEDEDQTVTFGDKPGIHTTATVGGEKAVEPVENITITDTVSYSKLTVGETYKLTGILMDKATNQPMLVDGETVTAEAEFTAETEDGGIDVEFTFNASDLAGKSVVVFEHLYNEDVEVAAHADISDEGQTVEFKKPDEPEIKTKAAVDGGNTFKPLGEITIIDSVTYSNLTPGKTYTVKGVLMDKATGEALLVNEQEITNQVDFTPDEANGTVDIPFTFDASGITTTSIVVFEGLYDGEMEVAVHADIYDEDQTVTVEEPDEPEIGTTATVNEEKTAEPVGEVTIVDIVTYSNLIPGKTYTLKGVLMDKATGEALLVNEQEITSEVEFTPETASGTKDISFTFDASALAGKSVVVFERLYNEDIEVAAHADISDEGQTVEFKKPGEPEIRTTASVNGEKTAEPVGEVTILDTVAYSDLIPGKTYTLKGVLMDKATGEKLLVDGKEVTAEKKFTPETASGTEEISFTFDASALAGRSVVVFEHLYNEDVEVAAHADISDEGQTVTFEKPEDPKIKTEATVDGEKETDPLDEITIIDKVSYSGLTPGKTYTIKGVLMDKATGNTLLVDDQEITAEQDFIPETAEGIVEMVFTLSATKLAGKSIVVFESLYKEGIEILVHADINDKNQTIFVRERGGLLIKKTAEDNFVEGISFLVTGKDYSKIHKTDKNGEIRVDGLTPGEYTVTEISDKVTARYEVQEGKKITVPSDGKTAEVKFYNKLLRGQIIGRKTDTEGDPLEGVTFGLFAKDAREFTADKAVATAKTDANGKFQFDNVPYGDWQIKELEALPGYVILADTIKVTVDSSKVTLADIQNEHTQIVISKVDSSTGKELPGAELEIRDKDGKVIESWISTDKPHTIAKLPVGEYTLHEVNAPEGYELAEDIKFTVKDSSEAITIVMQDKPSNTVDTPQTGDYGWKLALAVFGVSLGGVLISLFVSRKKKKEID